MHWLLILAGFYGVLLVFWLAWSLLKRERVGLRAIGTFVAMSVFIIWGIAAIGAAVARPWWEALPVFAGWFVYGRLRMFATYPSVPAWFARWLLRHDPEALRELDRLGWATGWRSVPLRPNR